jgi:hypothetical protein
LICWALIHKRKRYFGLNRLLSFFGYQFLGT